MPRLDNAGVDWAYRDLVKAFALSGQKGVATAFAGGRFDG